jgi:hypothetical protein
MDNLIIELNKDTTQLYHSETQKIPNYYAFNSKVAEKYVTPENRNVYEYNLTKNVKVVDMSSPNFIDNLFYQIFIKNWYYTRIKDVYSIMMPLGLANDDEIFEYFRKYNIYIPENSKMCDIIVQTQDNSSRFAWFVAKKIIKSGRFIQRNSVGIIDDKLFRLLTELYTEYDIDGFITKFNLPSIILCGVHHPELYLVNPEETAKLKIRPVLLGGHIKKIEDDYIVDYIVTGDPKVDEIIMEKGYTTRYYKNKNWMPN